MPVSHIGLTVSHLPTSCSFFLAALQPLGYRFVGQQGNQIGLGIHDADFFLCQETPGVKAGAAHIAFTAPSRTAVRDFYTAALNAGGRPNGAPATRSEEVDHFNAAVLDFDGNSIEVVFRNGPDLRDDGTVIEHSRVITWQRSVAGSYRDDRSVVSARTVQSSPKQALVPAVTEVKAPSTAPKAASIARSVSGPVAVPQASTSTSDSGDGAAKKIIGTLIGAAAGAAVAYAMVKSEQDSAKKESEFNAFMKAKAAASQIVQAAQAIDQSKPSQPAPQAIQDTTPQSIHRNIGEVESHYSTPRESSVYMQRAIEAAPQSYHSPSYTSVPPTQVGQRAIEYVPAYSAAPSRTQFTAPRSVTNPELTTVSKAKSTASRAQSVAQSAAPSTLISSFVPDKIERRDSEGSVHSHHSSKSRAKSTHSHASKHSSHSKHTSKTRSRAPSPPPTVVEKAQSIVGSILGRDSKSNASKNDDLIDDFEIEEINDTDTVAPSDSISNAGSRRSHRSRRSNKDKDGSVVSKHSSASKHSRSSKHSHSSKRSHHSSSASTNLSQEWFNAPDTPSPRKTSVVSEPSDASTVKPAKSVHSSHSKSSRKDSLTDGKYDGMFSGKVEYGTGSVASLPIRGITPSMIGGGADNGKRSVMSYAMGQRLRPFEVSE